MENDDHIGEIISSNSLGFQAAGIKGEFPGKQPIHFGQLLKVQTPSHGSIYAIASYIEHSALDSSRQIVPLGKTQDELQREMPQVFELIQTVFHAIHVGYDDHGTLSQGLPLHPPHLHNFVYLTSENEKKAFFEHSPVFIRLIMNNQTVQPDELIVAFLRYHKTFLQSDTIIKIGKELSYFFGDDHRRLESLLERI